MGLVVRIRRVVADRVHADSIATGLLGAIEGRIRALNDGFGRVEIGNPSRNTNADRGRQGLAAIQLELDSLDGPAPSFCEDHPAVRVVAAEDRQERDVLLAPTGV